MRPFFGRIQKRLTLWGWSLLWCAPLLLAACKHFHQDQHDHVYVAARQVYLHDRVAAVSNRVGQVTNGEALEVIERGKRFVKVKTPKGEVGWLEDHAIIDDKLYAQFEELSKAHAHDLVVANAELRDDLYLHVQPGRESPHFLLIPGNAKVQLLERGTVEKAAAAGMPGLSKSLKAKALVGKPAGAGQTGGAATERPEAGRASGGPELKAGASAAGADVAARAVPMEDWWLVRDAQGHTGWLLAGRLDVDVPDEVGVYAEGQRIVGAYPIAKVMDYAPDREHRSGQGKLAAKLGGRAALKAAGKTAEKNRGAGSSLLDKGGDEGTDAGASPTGQPKEFTEYVTVLSPPRGGLPYDFDQVRVFVWSLNHHRYETGFRLHGIEGYLPVKMGQETVNGQAEPTFSFQIADGQNVSVDPDTGVTRPVAPRTLSFRLEGNMIRRTGQDQAPVVLTHDTDPNAKKKVGKKKH